MPTFNRTKIVDRQSSPLTYSWIDYNPNGSVYSTNGPVLANFKTGVLKIVMDSVTPNYAAKRKSGQVVLNDCDRFSYENSGSAQLLDFGTHWDWGRRVISGHFIAANRHLATMPSWFSTDITNAGSLTLIKAHAKMNQSEFQSLVSLAEFHKTVALLAGPLHAFYSLTVNYAAKVKRIRRRLLRQAKTVEGRRRLVQDVHNELGAAWLQYRYGWTPLMHDIEGITKAFNEIMGHQKKPPLSVKRSSTELAYVMRGTSTIGALCSGQIEYVHDWTVKVTAGVIYKVNDALLHQQARHYVGLDLRSIPIAAWELVPYSFVVDWFVNVGDWLEACLPNPHVTIEGNWVTTKTSLISTNFCGKTTVTLPSYTPPGFYQSGGGSTKEISITTSRRVGLPLPALPQLTIRPLGTLHTIDGLELILQRIKSIK